MITVRHSGIGLWVKQRGQSGVVELGRQRPRQGKFLGSRHQFLDGAEAGLGTGVDLPQ
ncbi:hypothetical protein HNR64_000926 [Spongiibacter marinus]|nr:hypothetical protein [Spongiibacter marinus]